jgi:hypothetical protein
VARLDLVAGRILLRVDYYDRLFYGGDEEVPIICIRFLSSQFVLLVCPFLEKYNSLFGLTAIIYP